jgi:hypothetical protein
LPRLPVFWGSSSSTLAENAWENQNWQLCVSLSSLREMSMALCPLGRSSLERSFGKFVILRPSNAAHAGWALKCGTTTLGLLKGDDNSVTQGRGLLASGFRWDRQVGGVLDSVCGVLIHKLVWRTGLSYVSLTAMPSISIKKGLRFCTLGLKLDLLSCLQSALWLTRLSRHCCMPVSLKILAHGLGCLSDCSCSSRYTITSQVFAF